SRYFPGVTVEQEGDPLSIPRPCRPTPGYDGEIHTLADGKPSFNLAPQIQQPEIALKNADHIASEQSNLRFVGGERHGEHLTGTANLFLYVPLPVHPGQLPFGCSARSIRQHTAGGYREMTVLRAARDTLRHRNGIAGQLQRFGIEVLRQQGTVSQV